MTTAFTYLTFPVKFGYCDDEREWGRLAKKFNLVPLEWVPDHCAACMNAFYPDGGPHYTVVCVKRSVFKGKSRAYIASKLAHECVHAWNSICRRLGEDKPGDETDAYMIEFMVSFCMDNYYGERS